LHLGAAPSFGLRRDDLIVKPGDLFGIDERLAAYERWRDRKAEVIERASAAGVRVQTATAWAADAARLGIDQAIADQPFESGIDVIEIPGSANRPRGARFGSLVHAVLATVPLDAAPDLVERGARTQARLLNAADDEIRASVEVVRAVLRHDLLARARASTTVRRETPVSWVQKDGTLIEGVLDLAFDENGATIVVDFKTDHELALGEVRYRAQLRQYLGAVSRVTGRPASGVLFRV
ncbi:MAG TPA: PD-(D/E)XK nuclease family protein, partial [Vicinamibacterales bacterium]